MDSARPIASLYAPTEGIRVGAPVISVEHLRKRYGEAVAVDDVSFEVAPGEIFGLLGPNGAGKTTTVECLQGLRRHDEGRVRVLGLDPQENGDELRRRIESQLQDSGLPSHLRVWEALDLFASIADHATDTATLLERWGLGDKRNARFASLSGGQQQRLLVALALVHDPEVVFLDEMTTGLDPAARRVAWDLIREIRERGVGPDPRDPRARRDDRARDALHGRGRALVRSRRHRRQRPHRSPRHTGPASSRITPPRSASPS